MRGAGNGQARATRQTAPARAASHSSGPTTGGQATATMSGPTDGPPGSEGFRILFAEHPQPMWVYDLVTLAFREVNDAAVQLYGYSREEFLDMRITDIRPAEDVGALLQDVARERPDLQHSGTWRHLLKDGRVIEVEIASHTIGFEGSPCALVVSHDVTERRRAERNLRCQFEVSRVMADADTLPEAAPRVVQAVCHNLGWELGEIWLADPDGPVLRCAGGWHAPSIDLEGFEARSRTLQLHPEEGVPGRVWATGEPAWLDDLPAHPELRRASWAAEAGLHAAVAVPIALASNVFGVMMFLGRDVRPPEELLLELMTGLGRQVGQFVHRTHAEDRSRHLAAIVDSSDDAIIGKSLDGRVQSWNRGAERIYGYTAEEALGRSLAMLLPPDRPDELEEILARVQLGEVIDHYETVRIRKDGTPIQASLTISPIRDPRGQIVGASTIARDITDQKRATEALAESEARKSAILGSALDCVITIDHRGMVMEFNPAAEATFGYSRADVVGKEMAGLIVPPADRERHRQGLARYLATGEGPVIGARLEMTAMRADGTEFPVELAITRVPGIDPPVFTGFVRDISRRKQSEQERARLLEQERAAREDAEGERERLAFLAEAGRAIASSLDHSVTLVRVAELAVPRIADWCSIDIAEEDGSLRRVALTHKDPAKVTWAKDLQDRFPPDPDALTGAYHVVRTGVSELFTEIPDEVLEAAVPDPELLEIVRALGMTSAMTVPLMARGHALGAMSFVSAESGRRYGQADLALAEELARHAGQAIDNARLYRDAQSTAVEVQRLNEELEARVAARTAELEAANRELEAFSYSVSHDLRAPLRAIDGFSRIVLAEFADGLPEQGRAYLDIVRQGAQQMGRLIDDLLAFARLSRQPLKREPVDPEEMVRRCLDELHDEQAGRTVHVTTLDLPQCLADPALLHQVFANLLSNALKFTRRRRDAVIEVGSLDRDDRRVYYVRDNGVGFDMRYADKLFGVFQRLHPAEEYEGTGVGLAIVQRVIHRHGGQVWAEAEPGVGTTFYFTIEGVEPDVEPD